MKFYTCANTSSGFVDLTQNNLFDVEKTISLNSSLAYLSDKIIRKYTENLDGNYDQIIEHGTKDVLRGIILKDKSLAIVSNYPDAQHQKDIHTRELPVDKDAYLKMLEMYKEAKKIHDDWEKVYINNMDIKKLNEYYDSVLSVLVKSDSKEGKGKVYKRFFGTVTPKGNVNYIDDITDGLRERYFIKGRPGTGKSSFLKRLTAELLKRGYDVEQYYCSFDPQSLDMVVSRELSFCVFDSTQPHEKFPSKNGDVILDFYEASNLIGTDEKFHQKLFMIKTLYDEKLHEAKYFFNKWYEEKYVAEQRVLLEIFDDEIEKICREIKRF